METKKLAVQSTAPAPIGANPIGDFIRTLPQEAVILGSKAYCSAGKEVIYVCYYWNGQTVKTSFSWEGGAL